MNSTKIAFIAACFAAAAAQAATTITENPDLGSYWYPLSPNGGTYVYANSFVAPVSGQVTSLGTWLNTQTYDAGTTLQFQVWGSVGGNPSSGPDYANVLASSSALSGFSGGLNYYSAAALPGLNLNAGDTYWFAATAVGSSGSGAYQVGGHTPDGGTFWYSNDPSGQNFDGQNLNPEMAFSVTIDGTSHVPEASSSLLLLAMGCTGIFGARTALKRQTS